MTPDGPTGKKFSAPNPFKRYQEDGPGPVDEAAEKERQRRVRRFAPEASTDGELAEVRHETRDAGPLVQREFAHRREVGGPHVQREQRYIVRDGRTIPETDRGGGHHLRDVREARGLSLMDLEKRAAVPFKLLWAAEMDGRRLAPAHKAAIAAVLNIGEAELP